MTCIYCEMKKRSYEQFGNGRQTPTIPIGSPLLKRIIAECNNIVIREEMYDDNTVKVIGATTPDKEEVKFILELYPPKKTVKVTGISDDLDVEWVEVRK